MADEETKEYREQLKKDGIDVESDAEEVITDESISGKFEDIEDAAEEKTETDEDKDESEDEEEDSKEESGDDDKDDLSDRKEPKKRSIYDEYKGKKSELKEEKELRVSAEKERDELKVKLEALGDADTTDEKEEASDDIDAFAKEIGADPSAIKKMKALFLKGIKPEMDESLKKDLDDFKKHREENRDNVERQAYDKELETIRPQLKKDFPKASDKEMKALEEKIDEISHNKEFHDKDLDYVLFKNMKTLTALVSPKKKGMETKERTDTSSSDDGFVFDPNADLSSLSPKDQELWQKQYQKTIKDSEESLVDNGQGGKIIL